MTRGQNKPLPKPCLTPGRNRVNLCQSICYQSITLDFKFQVNPSIKKDFMTRGQNWPLPKPCLTPGRNRVNLFQSICYQEITLDFKFQVNPTTNKDSMAQCCVRLSLRVPNTHTYTHTYIHTHTHTHTQTFLKMPKK